MPKVAWSPQYQREKAVKLAVARARIDLDLNRDYELAQFVGIDPGNFSRYKRANFQGLSFKQMSNMARKLNFTAKEWCDIAGVPYDGE